MSRISFVLGGISSGKSDFAEELCASFGGSTAYIATSVLFDDEMIAKADRHKEKRHKRGWDTIENAFCVGESIRKNDYDTYIVDCVSMLVSNMIFMSDNYLCEGSFRDEDEILINIDSTKLMIEARIKEILEAIRDGDVNCVIVSNEVGLGGISGNTLTRIYAQVLGEMNQLIAKEADEVYFVAAGIPMKMK